MAAVGGVPATERPDEAARPPAAGGGEVVAAVNSDTFSDNGSDAVATPVGRRLDEAELHGYAQDMHVPDYQAVLAQLELPPFAPGAWRSSDGELCLRTRDQRLMYLLRLLQLGLLQGALTPGFAYDRFIDRSIAYWNSEHAPEAAPSSA